MGNRKEIYSAAGLMAYIQDIGFLPLLDSGIQGFSAEAIVSDDCRYVVFPNGGWDWPLWKWKGPIIADNNILYGKFFAGKAGFISKEWWPDFCNYRRSKYPTPEGGTIEEAILSTLSIHGSLITRELRKACGFTGTNMRGKFDAYITRLQMGCHIVTQDFIYPTDKHGQQYGWGWSLLTTPENLLESDECQSACTPEESHLRLITHFEQILPAATERQRLRLIG